MICLAVLSTPKIFVTQEVEINFLNFATVGIEWIFYREKRPLGASKFLIDDDEEDEDFTLNFAGVGQVSRNPRAAPAGTS